MSNAIDILLLDGPAHGTVMCTDRPVPATLDCSGATYTTSISPIEGVNYRVALLSGSDWSDDTVHMHIGARDWQPAWDLNPPFTEMPQVPA